MLAVIQPFRFGKNRYIILRHRKTDETIREGTGYVLAGIFIDDLYTAELITAFGRGLYSNRRCREIRQDRGGIIDRPVFIEETEPYMTAFLQCHIIGLAVNRLDGDIRIRHGKTVIALEVVQTEIVVGNDLFGGVFVSVGIHDGNAGAGIAFIRRDSHFYGIAGVIGVLTVVAEIVKQQNTAVPIIIDFSRGIFRQNFALL